MGVRSQLGSNRALLPPERGSIVLFIGKIKDMTFRY